MKTTTIGFAALGCAIGTVCGWYFDQIPTEAGLGLVAGALLGATIRGRAS